jgi:hypothetical protein
MLFPSYPDGRQTALKEEQIYQPVTIRLAHYSR